MNRKQHLVAAIKKYLFLILFLWEAFTLSAQISHGGSPAFSRSGAVDLKRSEKAVTFRLSDDQRRELADVKPAKGRPLRFAHPFFTELTPANSGIHSVLADGRLLWQLAVRSPGAYSLNLIFDRFQLQEGDSLFVYTPGCETVLGAFTALNNKPWGGLATAPVPGDELIVELKYSRAGDGGTDVMIGAVNHDYLNVFSRVALKVGNFGDSDDCHPDISCFSDEGYLSNGRSVCKIIVNGTEFCSGTLLNNTLVDGRPYFMTAGHCLDIERGQTPESAIFIFNNEVPQCQDYIEGTSLQTVSGSSLRAFADTLDFALLEMSERPPVFYRPYYAGWDLTPTPQSAAYTIHHPQGDVKKVAESAGAPYNDTFNANSPQGNRFVEDAHWHIDRWENGSTEQGSSGGGLFTGNNLFIGHLSGGAATCSNPVHDYFVRLNKIWDHVPLSEASVAPWLNPGGLPVGSLQGFDPAGGQVQRLTHFPKEANPSIVYLKNGTGFWSGPNSRNITAVAEHYPEILSGLLYGVYLMPGISKTYGEGKINVKVWSGLDSPQFLIGEKQGVSIAGKKNKEVLVMFDEPLMVTGSFFVGYEVDYTQPVDSFGVYQVPLPVEKPTSLYVNDPYGGWKPYNYLEPGLGNASLWIELLMGDAVVLDTGMVEPPGFEFFITPNPATSYLDIFCDENGDGQATVFDLSGKVYGSAFVPVFNYRGRLRLPALREGLYLLKFELNGRERVRKFLVKQP